MEKVGLLGAMDVHAWPDPFEEVQQVAQEEEPAVEEEATQQEEVKQQADYEKIQAAEQQIQQPVFAAQQQQPVAEAVVEEVPTTNVMETANPQWVNTNALAVQQQANIAAQVGASGIVTSAVAIDPQTGQPFATPADGGASLSQSLNTDLSKPPASWPVDMESGVQCNPIIGCVAGVPYPGIGCCETATLTPEDVAPTQTQQQVPVNPYQYPIAGAVTTQPAAALPYQQQPQQVYQQQQPVQQQQAQDPYAAYQQQLQAAPGAYATVAAAATGSIAQPGAEINPVGENGLPECNVAEDCVAGVPIPGIGCCNEAEKALIMPTRKVDNKLTR